MARTPELLAHAEALLAAQEWPALALHVRLGAQQVASRAESWAWRRLIDRVPAQQRGEGAWPHALAWVAYRVADRDLLAGSLGGPGVSPAFQAFDCSLHGDWEGVLTLTGQALQDSAVGRSPDAVVAARFQACALAELRRVGWDTAFRTALQRTRGRDRGLLGLEFAYYLIRAGQEGAARDVLAGAVLDLRGDPWSLTLAQANLGISCIRLNELTEAERALRQAVRSGAHPEGRAHLSTAWRGLGGLYLRQGQPARAGFAYETAQAKADNDDDRIKAMRSLALVARLEGRLNDAMTLLHGLLHHARVPEGQPHPVYADLAAVRLLAADPAGARSALRLAPQGSLDVEDGWRAGVVRAELLRLEGQSSVVGVLQALRFTDAWARQEAWVFPALFAQVGIDGRRPVWEATVHTGGPVRVVMNGVEVGLRPHRPAAALLALLALHGGRVSAERALEALELAGDTPRARRQELSRTVRDLWDTLGWRGAATLEQGIVRLSPEVTWHVVTPAAEHSDTFCEGRYDDWILEWRNEHAGLSIPHPL